MNSNNKRISQHAGSRKNTYREYHTLSNSFPSTEWTSFTVPPSDSSSRTKSELILVTYMISPVLRRTILFGNLSRTWKATYLRVANALLFLTLYRKKFPGSSSVLWVTMYCASAGVRSRKSTSSSTSFKPSEQLMGRERAALSRYRFLKNKMNKIMILSAHALKCQKGWIRTNWALGFNNTNQADLKKINSYY